MTRFAALPSAIPFSPVRTSERRDPLYDAIWSDGSQAAWIGRARALRRIAAGTGKLPASFRTTPDDAWRRFESDSGWQTKLDVLGAIDTWRTATAEQLAAITGHDEIATGRHSITNDLFAMDAVEVGLVSDALHRGPKSSRVHLFRPGRPSAAIDQIAERLTYPEWVSVTAGSGFEFTRQFDRHNLLATELGLRVAEFCRIGTVLGEKLSTVDALAFSGWGQEPPTSDSQRAADLVVVREDGLRIAVEITASRGPSLTSKIDRWAQTLSRRRLSDNGLIVLFIVAGVPDSSMHTTAAIMKSVRHQITTSGRMYPGPHNDRTVDRMFVVAWDDWFPKRGSTTGDFVSLNVERNVGPTWEPTSLLTLPYSPSAGLDPQAVIHNSSGLRSVPYWLRKPQRPVLWQTTMASAGFTSIPHLEGLTDKGRVRAEFASPRGTARAPETVPRLRF